MPWVETVDGELTARHAERDAGAARDVIDLVADTRDRLAPLFPEAVGEAAIVIHDSALGLYLAQPYLALARWRADAAARRYLAGWVGRREVHVLSPARLAARASGLPESHEALELAPAALYAQLVVAANNPGLPPPFTPASMRRYLRWSWLAQGSAQYFSGQTAHLRPAIARRLREGPPPALPPAAGDAWLLGGTVFDLLAREEGTPAAVALASRLHPAGPVAALRDAFHGRAIGHTAGTWRAHLARLASAA